MEGVESHFTPASVKVIARIPEGGVSGFRRVLAMRSVSTVGFPVPGPAITMTGPSIVSTASFFLIFRSLQGHAREYSIVICSIWKYVVSSKKHYEHNNSTAKVRVPNSTHTDACLAIPQQSPHRTERAGEGFHYPAQD